jgi:hypothetical protein
MGINRAYCGDEVLAYARGVRTPIAIRRGGRSHLGGWLNPLSSGGG